MRLGAREEAVLRYISMLGGEISTHNDLVVGDPRQLVSLLKKGLIQVHELPATKVSLTDAGTAKVAALREGKP